MTKIKEVKEFKKANGKKGWIFILEDGKEGFITNDSPWTYEAGQEVDYTLEVKKKSNGETYNLITFSTPNSQPAQQSAPTTTAVPQTTKNQSNLIMLKFDGRMKCIQLAHDTYLAGKLDDNEAKNHCREWVVLADALIDDLAK